ASGSRTPAGGGHATNVQARLERLAPGDPAGAVDPPHFPAVPRAGAAPHQDAQRRRCAPDRWHRAGRELQRHVRRPPRYRVGSLQAELLGSRGHGLAGAAPEGAGRRPSGGRGAVPGAAGGAILWRRIKDDTAFKAIVRAYNEWLIEEYCSVAPERL